MASRRSHLTLVVLIIAAMVGVAMLAIPGSPAHRSLKQGLDLQGGLEVVLQAETTNGHVPNASDLDRSISIMRSRVDKLGVSQPVIRKQGTNQIVIQLPAVHDTNQAAAIIGQTAQLELYDLTPSLLGSSIDASDNAIPHTKLFQILTSVQTGQPGTPSAYYLFDSNSEKTAAGPATSIAALKNLPAVKKLKPIKAKTVTKTTGTGKKKKTTTKVVKPGKTTAGFPTGYQVLSVPKKAVVVTCDATIAQVCPGVTPVPGTTYYYLFKHGSYANDTSSPYPQMTGSDLKLSGTQADFDPTTGAPIVTLQFKGEGNKLFHEITRNEAIRGQQLGNQDYQSFAIVLDNQIYSFPTIDYTQNPDGIDPSNGGAEITGIGSISEAKSLALVLQTGALPVRFATVERTDVSATLGKDSLKQARNAALGGLIAVILFLLILYRFLGVVAVIGLAIYAALLYGAILIFGVVLTLPGFAGLVLTIGVAADANVVIFERIKEEVRGGKSVRAAIAAGYAKGFHTIVDANVVTCIAALILLAVATADVKGFALMLLIGTVLSLVTSVVATRAMLGLLSGFRWFEHPRFMGSSPEEIPRWQRIDVVGRRRLWFVLSIAAVVISILAIGFKGLNLGIDFKGGVQVTFTTAKPTPIGNVRQQAIDIGRSDAVVQGRGKTTGTDSYTSFQIALKKLDNKDLTTLTNDLTAKVAAEKLSVKSVSASFSHQILDGAIAAILVSFVLIAAYVSLRFKWRFAIPILRTLINDIPITLGVYAISGREVTASTVAALLTILGYSVYDTIIVFDRVRENLRLMPRASIATIANVSVWEVLKRSIVTSVITLIPIVALFSFGGATLKDFAFAIMVGIAVGAVSTIFIATPLLTSLLERDPNYARRVDDPDSTHGPRGGRLLRRAEKAATDAPAPETPMDAIEDAVQDIVEPNPTADAKRERRRQRRQNRPHGRPR